MKKIAVIVLSIILAFGLIGCEDSSFADTSKTAAVEKALQETLNQNSKTDKDTKNEGEEITDPDGSEDDEADTDKDKSENTKTKTDKSDTTKNTTGTDKPDTTKNTSKTDKSGTTKNTNKTNKSGTTKSTSKTDKSGTTKNTDDKTETEATATPTPAVHVHIYTTYNYVAATCTTSGHNTYKTCSCGSVVDANGNETSIDAQTIPATGHNWQSNGGEPATCYSTGCKCYYCSNCGATYDETIPIQDHNYVFDHYESGGTCSPDINVYKCVWCDSCYAEKLNSKTHNWIWTYDANDPTLEHFMVCDKCGMIDWDSLSYHTFYNGGPGCDKCGCQGPVG